MTNVKQRRANRTARPDERRVAFKKALIDEGTTVTAFAEKLGIWPQSLNRAFREPRAVSRRVHDVIDQLIAKHSHAA